MQRYTNIVQDSAGNALSGVTVAVYDQGTANLSTLFTANGSGAKSNSFTNDTDGTFEFYAANGRYDAVYTKTGYTFTAANTTDLLLYDRADDFQKFRLTANGSAVTTIGNFFGTTSNIPLAASAIYFIEIVLYFLKTTSEAVTVTLTNSAAPSSQNIYWEQSPITGIVAPPGTATALVGQTVNNASAALAIVTGSLTTAVNHYIRLRIELKNGAGTSLKIQVANPAGSVTPLLNSYWTATKIPATNTDTYAA